MPSEHEAWNHRRSAARTYQPRRIRLLLVDEAPSADDRYFYFDSGGPEMLMSEVCAVLFEKPPADRVAALKELRRRGVFAVHLKPDAPRHGEALAPYVAPFLLNVDTLAPQKILIVGGDAYDVLHAPMKKARLPVIDVRIPGPGTDEPLEFRQKFRQGLVRAGLENLIRPLPVRAPRVPAE